MYSGLRVDGAKGGLYGPLYKRHLGGCAIYSQSTVPHSNRSPLVAFGDSTVACGDLLEGAGTDHFFNHPNVRKTASVCLVPNPTDTSNT